MFSRCPTVRLSGKLQCGENRKNDDWAPKNNGRAGKKKDKMSQKLKTSVMDEKLRMTQEEKASFFLHTRQ